MKNPRFYLLAIGLLSLSMLASAAWTTKRLSDNEGDTLHACSAISGTNVYVAWCDDTPGNDEIYFTMSANGGATWKSPQRLTFDAEYSMDGAVAASGANVYVVWEDMRTGNGEIYFRKSSDYGKSWHPIQRLTYTSSRSWAPAIAVQGADIYVAWVDYTLTPGFAEIYLKKSPDGGATWQPSMRLSYTANESREPAIAAGGGANVHVVWADRTPLDYEIYFRKSTDGGATWQAVRQLTDNEGESWNPRIAVEGANLFVVWWDASTPGNDEIYFIKSDNGGATWRTATRLTYKAGISTEPDVAASGANVYVAWTDWFPGNPEIYFRKSADSGATWETAKRLTNRDLSSYSPTVAVSDANVYVAWHDNFLGGGPDIYIKYSPL